MTMKLTFGELVRNFREDMDLTQSEMGKKVNMTQRKLSYIEKNQCEPSVEDIKALCIFFNISADYLLGLPDSLEYPNK